MDLVMLPLCMLLGPLVWVIWGTCEIARWVAR
jgi:hypothetical protein